MTPWELAKSGSEHAHQRALFAYVNMAIPHGWQAANDPDSYSGGRAYAAARYAAFSAPVLELFYAVANGGERHKAVAAKLKAEGVRAGVPDTHLPVACGQYHSLYIEMKEPKKEGKKGGGLNDAQKRIFPKLIQAGNAVAVCYTWQQAVETLQAYLLAQPILRMYCAE